MSTNSKPQGKAMYVASQLDKSWLTSEQRKLYLRSWETPDFAATSMESPVRNERRTPGSEEGPPETAG
jgi:hypothetical protein